MKKIIGLILLVVFCILLFCGCMQKQIITVEQELKSHKWSSSDSCGKSAELYFNGDTAVFNLKSGDKSAKIIGNALIDESTFSITDGTYKKVFVFKYKLYGDKTEITSENSTITLFKEKE